MTAIAAKMARVVHAVVKGGSDYRPFVEERCQVEEPLSARAVRASHDDPVDNVRSFHLDQKLVLGTVRPPSCGPCVCYGRDLPLPVEATWFDDLTNVTQQEHADEQRDFDCLLPFLPLLGRYRS